MNYHTLKSHETEGIAWGLITAIMLGVSGVSPVFSIVVGIIFIVVAVYVLETQSG
jgi:hypothetical protein